MNIRLGVNIDHVATIRQARGEQYPSLPQAATECLKNGADQITIHLREDRRHIQGQDIFDIKKVTDNLDSALNLEMGSDMEIVRLACELGPAWVCVVPEKRQELTTEGGLNLMDDAVYGKVETAMELLRKNCPNTKISLFLEASNQVLTTALKLKPDAVEIHTGEYAKDHLTGGNWQRHRESFFNAYHLLKKNHIGVHAGHGLTDESLAELLEEGWFEEYNIGHWIVSQSIFLGIGNVVRKLKKMIRQKNLEARDHAGSMPR